MLKRFKNILAMTLVLLVCSCDDLRDSYDDCGIWLEFVFDHNMEYTDSFVEQVGSVDVLVFDSEGKLVLIKAATTDELEGRKRMFLGGSLPMGDYSVVTVGGMTDHFRFTHHDGSAFAEGQTAIDDVRVALHREEEAQVVSHEFPHLWHGQPVEIRYRADLSVWQVPLIRQTNNFNVTLKHTITHTRNGSATRAEDEAIYTVEIVAPESGVYNHLNEPLVREKLTYQPYSQQATIEPLETGTGMEHNSTGRINTMRLLSNEEDGYQLVIRNTDTGVEVANYDLFELLGDRDIPSRSRPDGTLLPFQEFLDRTTDWNIVIVHKGPATEGFVAMQIIVNDWIVWYTGMEVG